MPYQNHCPQPSTNGYCPPLTFAEFYELYPRFIRTRLLGRWGLKHQDLEDWEQELILHLLSIPRGSIFEAKGCVDRISTYDPSKRGGGSERLFLDYIHLLIDNYYRRTVVLNRNRLISSTTGIADLAAPESAGEGVDEEAVIARYSAASRANDEPLSILDWQQFLNRAYRVHPLLAYVCDALSQHSTKKDAAASLGLKPHQVEYISRYVRAFVAGDQATLTKFDKGRKRCHPNMLNAWDVQIPAAR